MSAFEDQYTNSLRGSFFLCHLDGFVFCTEDPRFTAKFFDDPLAIFWTHTHSVLPHI